MPQKPKTPTDLIQELMLELGRFSGLLHAAKEACREKYREQESEPRNRLRILIDGLMALLARDAQERVATITEATSYQIGLSVSFVRTHFVASNLIMNGDVIEGFILVRKQLESLARMNELDSRPLERLHGRTPNIQNALKQGAGRIYGALSEVAHFSTPRVTELLHVIEEDERVGPSVLNVYSEQAGGCMDLLQFIAIYYLVWQVEKFKEWYPNLDHTDRVNALAVAVGTALEAGVIHESEEAKNAAT